MNPTILSKYTNKWVALSTDRKKVITSAKSIKDLNKKVQELPKKTEVIYHHVLPINGSYTP